MNPDTHPTKSVFSENLNKQQENTTLNNVCLRKTVCLTVTSAIILKSLLFGFMTTDMQFRREKLFCSSHIFLFYILILIQ